MKKIIMLFFTLVFLSSCSSETETEGIEANGEDSQDNVVQLGEIEEINSDVYQTYFSDLDDFPEANSSVGNKEDDIYWQKATNSPMRSEKYFPRDNFAHYIYDSSEDNIEVAYILLEGATVQEEMLEDDLYVSWIYDFNEQDVNTLIQENKNGESQDIIHFSDDEWEDFSKGHKDFLLQLFR